MSDLSSVKMNVAISGGINSTADFEWKNLPYDDIVMLEGKLIDFLKELNVHAESLIDNQKAA